MTSTGSPERDGYRFMAQLLDHQPRPIREATARALDTELARIPLDDPRALAIKGALRWITEHIEDD